MSSSASKYGNGLVIVQDRSSSSSTYRPSSGYSSASSASRSSSSYSGSSPYYSSTASSMNSSSNSSSRASGGYSDAYRSGSATSYRVDVKEKTNSSGTGVVVVNHYRPNPATDEPRSSDYYSSRSSSGRNGSP